jgi:hypothetical protein
MLIRRPRPATGEAALPANQVLAFVFISPIPDNGAARQVVSLSIVEPQAVHIDHFLLSAAFVDGPPHYFK